MNESLQQMTEDDLKHRICALKDRHAYHDLKKFLIGELSAGHVPAQLQVKAYNELGVAHLQLDEPAEAEKSFLLAIESDPKAVNPRFNRANIALFAKKYTTAFGQYQDLLALDPDHVGATYHSGLCLALTDRPVEALPYFLKSAKAEPERMGPNFWSGETLVALERFSEALPYFTKAAELTPDHRESHRGIAICLFEQGEYADCIAQCDMLIQSGGGSEYLAFRIKGDALIEMGQIEVAAVCHLELADMDFDARDYLVMRAKDLAKHHPDAVSRYVEVILDMIPELERAFSGVVPAEDSVAASEEK
ncbi:tetratricopeptide repeat protein [Pseudodesulfovibrio sp. JC047]|uniref:tetratricopeptide repeat protein n=1 Tax=Pseudodesulfovibrio sp. JC047 TaxID=2683199 RepID=UPI0013D11EF5|nr:tetratricopeptide repeat protein [Pseudodesulfovibrio sp. JC047]NDV19472.1 tetratricopeptide repeat protein [Pseudodesulfovibrio sp. JC047]